MMSMAKAKRRMSGPSRGTVVRAMLMLPVLALAYLAGSAAMVSATRVYQPATALAVNPADAVALAVQADKAWGDAAAKGKALDVSKVAAQSLRSQAINPRAARLLAFGAEAGGNRARAEQLNLIAARLTRRESGAQLWLMENSIERNEVPAVLARYDTLLRTNTSMQALLYPKLALALSDPEINEEFVPYIREVPIWLGGFIDYAMGAENPDALSYAIRRAGGLPKGSDYRNREAILLGQLFARQKFAEGRAFFYTLKGSDPRVPTSGAFTPSSVDQAFAPVSWKFESGSQFGAAVEKSGEAHSIRAFATSGATGTAAYKFLFIPPGTYRFGSMQSVSVPSANSRASWVLRCMSSADQAVIYQYDIIRSALAATPTTQVTIPANCPVQRLDLSLAGGDDAGGLELHVARVEIGR
jgi:hypothetical protein